MDAISYTNARSNLAKMMQQVCDDHSPVIITRSKAHSVVMLSHPENNDGTGMNRISNDVFS